MDQAPVLASASPFPGNVHHGQVQHFQQAVIRGENGLCLGNLAQLAVETLNGVGGIDESADLLWVLEIGAQIVPVIPPGAGDFGVFLVPVLGKGVQCIKAAVSSTAAYTALRSAMSAFKSL